MTLLLEDSITTLKVSLHCPLRSTVAFATVSVIAPNMTFLFRYLFLRHDDISIPSRVLEKEAVYCFLGFSGISLLEDFPQIFILRLSIQSRFCNSRFWSRKSQFLPTSGCCRYTTVRANLKLKPTARYI